MKKLNLLSHKYYELGLNVTCIGSEINDYNFYSHNLLKAPNHEWKHYFNTRQTKEELENLNFNSALGLGTVTGYQDILVLDFDGCTNYDIIRKTLDFLELPKNYEWITQSGSGIGYHLYVNCKKPKHIKDEVAVSKYPAHEESINEVDSLELLWKTHVVLPPSKHITTQEYKFINTRFPKNLPKEIKYKNLELVIDKYFESGKITLSSGYFASTGSIHDAEVFKLGNTGALGTKKYRWIDNIEREDFNIIQKKEVNKDYITYYPVENKIDITDDSDFPEKKDDEMFHIIIDIETDGLIKNKKFPTILQIAWVVLNDNSEVIRKRSFLINHSVNRDKIVYSNLDISLLKTIGKDVVEVLNLFMSDIECCDIIVAHNLDFDLSIIKHHLKINNLRQFPKKIKQFCTMEKGKNICKLTNNRGYKYPKLTELYMHLFEFEITQLHNAEYDVLIATRCYRKISGHW